MPQKSTAGEGLIGLTVSVIVFVILLSSILSMGQDTFNTSGTNVNAPKSIFPTNQQEIVWVQNLTKSSTTFGSAFVLNEKGSPTTIIDPILGANNSRSLKIWVIRNNTQYHSSISQFLFLMNEKFLNSRNFFVIGYGEWGGADIEGWLNAYGVCPYNQCAFQANLSNDANTSLAVFNFKLLEKSFKVTIGVQFFKAFDPLWRNTNPSYASNLYGNAWDLTVTEIPQNTTATLNPLDVAWMLLSFNADWIGGNQIIAALVSLVVDTLILFVAARWIQGFIP